jgi:hypothetical protein
MKMSVLQAVLISASLTTGATAQNGLPQPENNNGLNMQQGNSDAQQRGPHQPPPEALAACDGKASGASCRFTGRQGEALTGTCFAPKMRERNASGQNTSGDQASLPLACRPAHGAPGEP